MLNNNFPNLAVRASHSFHPLKNSLQETNYISMPVPGFLLSTTTINHALWSNNYLYPEIHLINWLIDFLIWELYQILHLCVLENCGPRMDSQWALGQDPWGLPSTVLSPLHRQHVVREGRPELEALQLWLCLPLLHLLYLHNHLVTVGLRKRLRVTM